MVDILKAPENDRFQVIAEHDAEDFVFDPTFFGIERSADVVFVQLTLAEGRRPPEATTAGRLSSRGHRSRRGGRQGFTEAGDYRLFAGWRSDPFFIDRRGMFFNMG
jgi:hypothetical protein